MLSEIASVLRENLILNIDILLWFSNEDLLVEFGLQRVMARKIITKAREIANMYPLLSDQSAVSPKPVKKTIQDSEYQLVDESRQDFLKDLANAWAETDDDDDESGSIALSGKKESVSNQSQMKAQSQLKNSKQRK